MDDMRFKTGGFNGLASGSVGSDKVLVVFTTALFSQFSSFPELPFLNDYNNQTKLKKNKIYWPIFHAIELVRYLSDVINNNSFLQIQNE